MLGRDVQRPNVTHSHPVLPGPHHRLHTQSSTHERAPRRRQARHQHAPEPASAAVPVGSFYVRLLRKSKSVEDDDHVFALETERRQMLAELSQTSRSTSLPLGHGTAVGSNGNGRVGCVVACAATDLASYCGCINTSWHFCFAACCRRSK